MRIAIIGGGSAGLVTAHLLDGVHEVTLFEREPILGGHVRTLNRNVACDLDPELILDAGVIEFEKRNFPTLFRLFDSLGCKQRPVPGTTTFWTRDGVHHLSPGSIRREKASLLTRLRQLIDLLELQVQQLRFNARTNLPEDTLEQHKLGDLLGQSDGDRWAALLATYAYSIPYERVLEMPAGLTIPTLRACRGLGESRRGIVGLSRSHRRAILGRAAHGCSSGFSRAKSKRCEGANEQRRRLLLRQDHIRRPA